MQGPWNYRKGSILFGPLTDPIYKPGQTNIGSPEVHLINGLYYIYYGLYVGQLFDIGYATSKTLDTNNWQHNHTIGIPPPHRYPNNEKDYAAIGPSLLVNATAVGEAIPHYLAFGSYNRGIFGIPMQDPPTRVQANTYPKLLIADQPLPLNKFNPRVNRTEGPLLYKRATNDYYIFYSRGSNSPGFGAPLDIVYRVEWCRSTNVDGPYIDGSKNPCDKVGHQAGTVLLQTHSNRTVYAPGGVGIFRDPVEGLLLTYQYWDGTSKEAYSGGKISGRNYLGFNATTGDPYLSPSKTND